MYNPKFEELLLELKKLRIEQSHEDWIDDIPKFIWSKYIAGNYKIMIPDLNIAKYRFYDTSIVVIKIFDNFIGIRRITNIYNENSTYKSIGYILKFHEMKEIKVISYKIKK